MLRRRLSAFGYLAAAAAVHAMAFFLAARAPTSTSVGPPETPLEVELEPEAASRRSGPRSACAGRSAAVGALVAKVDTGQTGTKDGGSGSTGGGADETGR